MGDTNSSQLRDAIKQAESKGYSKAEIKGFMSNVGYSNEEIDEVFREILAPDAPKEKITCPKCGTQNYVGARFCVSCGEALSSKNGIAQKTPKSGGPKRKIIALALVAVIVVIGIYVLFFMGESPFSIQETKGYGAVMGEVYDDKGAPVEGVKVSGDLETTTNSNGEFELGLTSEGRKVITFEKGGFVPVHKIIQNNMSQDMYLNVYMPKQEEFVTVTQDSYSNRVQTDDAELNFPKNSMGDEARNYTPEDVKVSLTYFDATDDQDIEAFPGEFEAIEDGNVKPIESFGFVKLMVEDKNGNSLDLMGDNKAEIKIKISGDPDEAPDEIPLWFFDTTSGQWTYKTTAKKTYDGYYEGEIDTVASWWNCDRTFERSWFDIIFSKKLADSPWRILLDITGLFIEPIDILHNTWIIINPHTSKLETVGAWIGMLPFVTGAMGNVIAKSIDDAMFHYAPLGSMRKVNWDYPPGVVDNIMSMAVGGIHGSNRPNAIGRFFDKIIGRGEVTNLWLTRYAPEYADASLLNNLYVRGGNSVETAFALKTSMSKADFLTGIAKEPFSSWKTAGFQMGSSITNLGGKALPLEAFELIPFTDEAYSAAIAAKDYIKATRGTDLIVHEVTSLGGNAASRTISVLHHIGAGSIALGKSTKMIGTIWTTRQDSSPNDFVTERSTSSFSGNSPSSTKSVSGSESFDLDMGVDHMFDMGSDQILGIDSGDHVELYSDGNLIGTEYDSNPLLNVYNYFNNDGTLSKTVSNEAERTYSYASDGKSFVETTKIMDTGYTYSTNFRFDDQTNTLTEEVPESDIKIETTYNDLLDPVKIVESYPGATSTYEYGDQISKTSVEYSNDLGTVTSKRTSEYNKGTNTVTTRVDSNNNGEKNRVEIIEEYDDSDNIISRTTKYYSLSGSSYTPEVEERTTFEYDVTKKANPYDSSEVLDVKEFKSGTVQRVDYTTGENSSYDLPTNEDYYTILTNQNGQITSIIPNKAKIAAEAEGIFDGLQIYDKVSYEYDDFGNVIKETHPGGFTEFVYGPDGELLMSRDETGNVIYYINDRPINQQVDTFPSTGSAVGPASTDTNSADDITQFLSQFGLDDLLFEAKVEGIGYNYEGKQFFDPTRDSKITIGARNQSQSLVSIILKDTILYQQQVIAGKPGETKSVYVGEIPLAGAQVSVQLDSGFSSPVQGFLVFEDSEYVTRSIMHVILQPGQTQTFKLLVPSDTPGKVRFRTFDFVTSGLSTRGIDRLTIEDMGLLKIDKDCTLKRVVIIVFDISGSMDDASTIDPSVSKFDVEKKVIKDLITRFGDNTLYGLIKFDSSAQVVYYYEGGDSILSASVDEIYSSVDKTFLFGRDHQEAIFEHIDDMWSGWGTDVEEAVIAGIKIAKNTISPVKRVVLMTDGGSEVDFDSVRSEYDSSVIVSTIGIFGENREEEYFDPEVLQEIARIGGGGYYEAGNYMDFYAALEEATKSC